jgi:hypothetical protein
VLLAGRNALEPTQRPMSFGLTFGFWFVLLYLVVSLVLALVVMGLSRVLRRPSVGRIGLGLTALSVLAILAFANSRPIVQLFTAGGSLRMRFVLPLLFLAGIAGMVAAAALPRARSTVVRVLTALTVVGFVLAFWPSGGLSAPSAPDADSGRPRARAAPRLSGERLLLFGLDGADWTYLEALMARGELPNLRALRERGVWGPLSTFEPTESPIIWTTVATGYGPERHGIRRFTTLRLRGTNDPLPRLRPIHRLGYTPLKNWLIDTRRIFESPVSGISRRVPALWDHATADGVPIAVLNWWATWPAEPILGDMVSERLNFWRFAARGWPKEGSRLTFPPELSDEVSRLVVGPEQVTVEDLRGFADISPEELAASKAAPFRKHQIRTELPFLHSMFETTRRVALHLVERGRHRWSQPTDMMLIVGLVDHSCHAALKYSDLVDDHIDASEEELHKYGQVVTEAYRRSDAFLGELMEAFGPGNVIVMSDHGFHLESYWPNWEQAYAHEFAPDGIFIAAGPAFGHGRVEGLSVYDVFPIMAQLKGFPLAKDLPGRLPLEVFTESLRSKPVQHVATYGQRDVRAAAGTSSETDDQMIDHLKALGYLDEE